MPGSTIRAVIIRHGLGPLRREIAEFTVIVLQALEHVQRLLAMSHAGRDTETDTDTNADRATTTDRRCGTHRRQYWQTDRTNETDIDTQPESERASERARERESRERERERESKSERGRTPP
eukprot:1676399-Rhodomonas_salina.5